MDDDETVLQNYVVPEGRNGHICVAYKNYMLIWGGYSEHFRRAHSYFPGSELWFYCCITEKWYQKFCNSDFYPPGMSGSSAVVIDDTLYLFGGYGFDHEGCTNKLFKLDLNLLVWEPVEFTGISPAPVDKTTAWQYNKKLYVFGGFGNSDFTLNGPSHDFEFINYLLFRGWTNQFYMYDPDKNVWTRPAFEGELPKARASHASAMINDKVYIFGGRRDSCRLNDLHCLDMKNMKWSGEIPVNGPRPQGRSWHSVTSLKNRYFVLYGGFSQYNYALSDCWRFDTFNNIWEKIELPFVKPRLWHGACFSVNNEVLIFGGCTSNILDLESIPQQMSDIIVIKMSPEPLFRLCAKRVLGLPQLYSQWDSLPRSICYILNVFRNVSSSVKVIA